jgi:hypothetical protein
MKMPAAATSTTGMPRRIIARVLIALFYDAGA